LGILYTLELGGFFGMDHIDAKKLFRWATVNGFTTSQMAKGGQAGSKIL
jgi:hypothetical protein